MIPLYTLEFKKNLVFSQIGVTKNVIKDFKTYTVHVQTDPEWFDYIYNVLFYRGIHLLYHNRNNT